MTPTSTNKIYGLRAHNHLWLTVLAYSSTSLITTICIVAFLGVNAFTATGLWSTWGDLIYFQGIAQISSSNGPIGASPNLGWPDGVSAWSHPQAGLFLMILFWLFGGVASISSAATLSWTFCVVAITNAVSILYFLRGISRKPILIPISISLAIALTLSPFLLLKMDHINVAAFYIVPLTFGLFWRLNNRIYSRNNWTLGFVLAIGFLLAPMWWVVVCLYLFVGFICIQIASTNWELVRKSSAFIAIGSLGFLLQLVLIASAPGTTAHTRDAWDSNFYGGRIIDILVASPFLNQSSSRLDSLRRGASVELSQVGIIGAFFSVLAILYFLVKISKKNKFDEESSQLGILSAITTLLFISGGLGNLQAGAFVFLNLESPARTWSRLTIILAVLGAAILFFLISKHINIRAQITKTNNRQSRYITGLFALSILFCALIVPDSLAARTTVEHISSFEVTPEYKAVKFLKQVGSKDCAVLQLPIESMPLPLYGVAADWKDTYYRGLIPFLIEPTIHWSFGDYLRKGGSSYLRELNFEISESNLIKAETAGFCYVLFDKKLAELSISNSIDLPGSILPGRFGKPIYNSERFDVYSIQ